MSGRCTSTRTRSTFARLSWASASCPVVDLDDLVPGAAQAIRRRRGGCPRCRGRAAPSRHRRPVPRPPRSPCVTSRGDRAASCRSCLQVRAASAQLGELAARARDHDDARGRAQLRTVLDLGEHPLATATGHAQVEQQQIRCCVRDSAASTASASRHLDHVRRPSPRAARAAASRNAGSSSPTSTTIQTAIGGARCPGPSGRGRGRRRCCPGRACSSSVSEPPSALATRRAYGSPSPVLRARTCRWPGTR